MDEKLGCQAPICPYCFDDHMIHGVCNLRDLKKQILINVFNRYHNSRMDEKQDGKLPDIIENMIRWL